MKSAPEDVVWKALADPTRRLMLAELSRQTMTTGQLVDAFAPRLVRTAVMKHLDILESARLIRTRREGRRRWNQLDPRPLQQVARWLERHVQNHETRLTQLKALAESAPPPPRP